MEAEEDKIVEHVKEAVHSLTDRKKSWSKKIGGFFWEILVIVIAVNLTIWFHNWNEKRHERELEKEFLIGARENLVADTVQIRSNINFYKNEILVYYDSVISQIKNNKVYAHYVDSLSFQLINNNTLSYDYSIFQSFSSAGNLRLIENKKLLNAIMNLYSTSLPFSEQNVKLVTMRRIDGFDKYIGIKTGMDIGVNGVTCKLSTIIRQPEVKYQIQSSGLFIRTMNSQNEWLINQIAAVIHEIDKELKDKFGYTSSK